MGQDGHFELRKIDREALQKAHTLAKAERLSIRTDFIRRFNPVAASLIPDGKDIDVNRIDPVLVEVLPNSVEEEFYRWWNLVWWSLPYERAYGRQIRYLVIDVYHKAVIGLIGLQSPILSWNVRDECLGIMREERDYWVNQSMSAQRLGAVPPYNYLLGGKLVALLLTSDEIRRRFYRKYANQDTVMCGRKLPARLLFITTTGAYGKSSVYQRLKFDGYTVSEFIGYSQGSGSFHISNNLYQDIITYLDNRGVTTTRGYGSGPSRKLRLIDTALQSLGFQNGAEHGISRAVYLFPMVKNLCQVIQLGERPLWHQRPGAKLSAFWKDRWAVPRSDRDDTYSHFKMRNFMECVERDMLWTCSTLEKR
ncbi:MAG: DUF4338 domain-containing protein [candidate division Zixibacteria bacterium]|nr:DUF4338 domain-containing protein [candidate division Zixibacteria bacterium]